MSALGKLRLGEVRALPNINRLRETETELESSSACLQSPCPQVLTERSEAAGLEVCSGESSRGSEELEKLIRREADMAVKSPAAASPTDSQLWCKQPY